MSTVRLRAAAVLLAAGIGSLGLASAPADATPVGHAVAAHDSCTRTSSHKCIRGGEFCPQKSYKHSGWDAQGRRYVCKGSRSHPHWEKP